MHLNDNLGTVLTRIDERKISYVCYEYYSNKKKDNLTAEWLYDTILIKLPNIDLDHPQVKEYINKELEFCASGADGIPIDSPRQESIAQDIPLNEMREYFNNKGIYRIKDDTKGNSGIILYDICKGERITQAEARDTMSDIRVWIETDDFNTDGSKKKEYKPVAKYVFKGDADSKGNIVNYIRKTYSVPPQTIYVEDGEQCINTWTGFGVPFISEKRFKAAFADNHTCLLLRSWTYFINRILASGDMNVAYDIWTWIAHIFQRPYEKPRVALCLRGIQGCGKGTINTLIQEMVGADNCHSMSSLEDIKKNFNAQVIDSLFVNIDEYKDDREARHLMKNLITEEKNERAAKNVNPTNVKNSVHFLLTTNDKNAFCTDSGERRYDVIGVDPILSKTQYAGIDAGMYNMCDKFWLFLNEKKNLKKVAPYMAYIFKNVIDMSNWSNEGYERTSEFESQLENNKTMLRTIIEEKIIDGSITFFEKDENYRIDDLYKNMEKIYDKLNGEYKIVERNTLKDLYNKELDALYDGKADMKYKLGATFGSAIEKSFSPFAICNSKQTGLVYWDKELKKHDRSCAVAFKKSYIKKLLTVTDDTTPAPYQQKKNKETFSWEYITTKAGVPDTDNIVDNLSIPPAQVLYDLKIIDTIPANTDIDTDTDIDFNSEIPF
jgi:hypothetical protein